MSLWGLLAQSTRPEVDAQTWLKYGGILAVFVVMIFVVRGRRRQHARWLLETAQAEVCPHLRPALEALLARGHGVRRLGMRGPEMPLEVYLTGSFDPAALATELQLAEPVRVSDRGALICPECWCELRGMGE
jgi:hypothetical protein